MAHPITVVASAAFLDLIRAAREEAPEAFLEVCFRFLNAHLKFQVLLLACAPVHKLAFGQGQLYGVTKQREMFESYAKVAHLDALSMGMFTTPGRAIPLDYDAPELSAERFRPFREHLLRYDIMHGGGVTLLSDEGKNAFVMGAIRSQVGDRLSPDELERVAVLAPYVREAVLVHQGRNWLASPEIEVDELPVALVDERGCFKQMTPAFAKHYWQKVQPPQGYLYLEADCLTQVARGEAWPLPNGFAMHAARESNGYVLRIREQSRVDVLSARERQVAEAYASGASYTEIARALAIAPATVRRHITNLYEKLGIGHRADLIAALAETA